MKLVGHGLDAVLQGVEDKSLLLFFLSLHNFITARQKIHFSKYNKTILLISFIFYSHILFNYILYKPCDS